MISVYLAHSLHTWLTIGFVRCFYRTRFSCSILTLSSQYLLCMEGFAGCTSTSTSQAARFRQEGVVGTGHGELENKLAHSRNLRSVCNDCNLIYFCVIEMFLQVPDLTLYAVWRKSFGRSCPPRAVHQRSVTIVPRSLRFRPFLPLFLRSFL